MRIDHEIVKVVNGVKATQIKLHGAPVVKYAELPTGEIRLLWVMEPETENIRHGIKRALSTIGMEFQ